MFKLPQVHVGIEVRNSPDIVEELHESCGFLASHLLEHGHSNFVFLTNKLSSNSTKYDGVRDVLKNSGKKNSLEVLEFACNTNIVPEILNACHAGFTAFICSNDHIAARLCKLLQHHNIRVPEDVAVTGFDGMAFTEYTSPVITTMRISSEEMARETVELLLARMKDPELPALIRIPVHFHCGESCGCTIEHTDDFFYQLMPAVIMPQHKQE